MNPILIGGFLGLIWGLYLLSTLAPVGSFSSFHFGEWIVIALALAFVGLTISWFAKWLFRR